MSGYIKRHLLEKEIILFQTGKHWIIFLPVILWFILAAIAYQFYFAHYLALVPLAIAVWCLLLTALDFFFSEYAITTQRILMKEGLFWRTSVENLVSAVVQLELQQSPVGQILNYGQLIVLGFGGSNRFSTIHNPREFQRQLYQKLEKQRLHL